jgi:hypothetical protein
LPEAKLRSSISAERAERVVGEVEEQLRERLRLEHRGI